jgi:hypothetical protein
MTEPLPNTTSPAALPPVPYSAEIDAWIQAAVDHDRLRILEIGYYIAGAMTAVGVSFLFIHFGLFLFLGFNPQFFTHSVNSGGHSGEPPPPGLFLGLAALIGLIILLGWTFGALQVYAGRCLKMRRHSLFIMIVAALECVFIPWGTFLGVCTFLVLERPSVRALFNRS